MRPCSRSCKRPVHYGCLDHDEPDWSFEEHCTSYQEWSICHDCYNYNVPLDVILAWAEVDPLPVDTADDAEPDDEVVEKVVGETRYDERTKRTIVMPSVKNPQAPAKYLVKWQDMSYRHLAWVPHAFLAAKYPAKLGNFLTRGSTVTFDAPKDDDPEDAEPDDDKKDKLGEAPLPDANAEERVPRAWRTVDRVLNVWYKHPNPKKSEEVVEYSSFKKKLPENQDDSIPLVAQCYVKWCDLAYKEGRPSIHLRSEVIDALLTFPRAFNSDDRRATGGRRGRLHRVCRGVQGVPHRKSAAHGRSASEHRANGQ